MPNPFDPVSWGKTQFARVNSGDLTMTQLIAALPPACSQHHFDVLACYCEKSADQTYLLHQEATRRLALEALPEWLNAPSAGMLRVTGHLVHSCLYNALTLDNHFKTGNRFVSMVWDVWRAQWGEHAELLKAATMASYRRFRPHSAAALDAVLEADR